MQSAIETPSPLSGDRAGLRHAIIRRFLQLLVQQVVIGLVLFVSAGTWRWARAWLYLGLTLLLLAANAAWVLPAIRRWWPSEAAVTAARGDSTRSS